MSKKKKWTVGDGLIIDRRSGKPQEGAIEFDMADNETVAGFGSFVSVEAANVMINDYVTDMDALENCLKNSVSLFQRLEALSQIPAEMKQEIQQVSDELIRTSKFISADQDIVAGIYGRELLMSLLSFPGCEGLRYVCCKYQEKNSIYLYPVNANGVNESHDYYYRVLKSDDPNKNMAEIVKKVDPGGEVKGNNTCRATVTEEIRKNNNGVTDDQISKLFAETLLTTSFI